MINRVIDNADVTKKSAEKYFDIAQGGGKVDKLKEERHHKLREFLNDKLDDSHKHKFHIKWKEQDEDIFSIVTPTMLSSEAEANNEKEVEKKEKEPINESNKNNQDKNEENDEKTG